LKFITVEFEFTSDRLLSKLVEALEQAGFDFNHAGPWKGAFLHSCQLVEPLEGEEAEVSYFLDCLERFDPEIQEAFREAGEKVADIGYSRGRGKDEFCQRHMVSLPLMKRMVEWDLTMALSLYKE
jgi:hypothetical protein